MSVILVTPILRLSISVVNSDESQQYIYYTDGTYYWRKGVRGYLFVIDKALTVTGFNGTQGVDWENVYYIE